MAMIHVNRGGTSLGTFSEEDVHAGLRTGRFAGSDLGWKEGMASWQALSLFPEFAADVAAGATAPAPAPIPSSPTSPPIAAPSPAAVGTGLPWDERQQRGLFSAFFETMKMFLTQPGLAFTAMKKEGGFGDPLIYAIIGGSVGAIFYVLFMLLMPSIAVFGGEQNPLTHFVGMGVGSIFILICIPIFIAAGAFIGAAILHVCLMVVGGAKRSYETTFRVVCFTMGSVDPLLIIPICGGVIVGVWRIVLTCIGLSRAHETTTGRAVLAVFLPLIVCCGGWILLVMIFGGIGALSHQGSH